MQGHQKTRRASKQVVVLILCNSYEFPMCIVKTQCEPECPRNTANKKTEHKLNRYNDLQIVIVSTFVLQVNQRDGWSSFLITQPRTSHQQTCVLQECDLHVRRLLQSPVLLSAAVMLYSPVLVIGYFVRRFNCIGYLHCSYCTKKPARHIRCSAECENASLLDSKVKVESFRFFHSVSYRYPYLTRVRFISSDRHAGMTLDDIAVQAVSSGECELTKFASSCIRLVMHPSALQPYEAAQPTANFGCAFHENILK